MSLGTILKDARERKGLTVADVAEQTHLLPQMVEEIEQDDFHRFAAAIYGRGFIRLYAECVGENPEPLVQEFSEIYSGARRPVIATRKVKTAPESVKLVESSTTPSGRPRIKTRVVETAPEEAEEPPAPSGSDSLDEIEGELFGSEDAASGPQSSDVAAPSAPIPDPAPSSRSREDRSLGVLFDPPSQDDTGVVESEPTPSLSAKPPAKKRPTVSFSPFVGEPKAGFSEDDSFSFAAFSDKCRAFIRSAQGRVVLGVACCLLVVILLVQLLPSKPAAGAEAPQKTETVAPRVVETVPESPRPAPPASRPIGKDGRSAALSVSILPPPDSYVE